MHNGRHKILDSPVGDVGRMFKETARRLLPDQVAREVERYRAYPRNERPLYLQVRISSALGLPKPKLLPVSPAQLFVFVCFGNIMRSPMCEALMHRECWGYSLAPEVASAGLNAVQGRLVHPWAITAASEFGIALEAHRARVLTPALVEQATVIFTMDFQNQVQLLFRYPQAKNKAFLLSAYAEEGSGLAEIPDPYYQDQEATRRCYQTLATCIRNLVRNLPMMSDVRAERLCP